MNASLIEEIPALDFAEVSITMPEWERQFEILVKERKPIRYDVFKMATIPTRIQSELGRSGYVDLILKDNQDLHFLVVKN